MAIILSALPSCRSASAVQELRSSEVQECRSSEVQELRRVDTIYHHDSIVLRERTIHDTVYITKEVFRDRLEARGERQKAVRTDTVVVTDYRDRVVKLPPERYVPKFYKWCTIALWAIGLLVMGYWLLKWWLKCRV